MTCFSEAEVIGLLAKSEPFKGLPDTDLKKLAALGQTQDYTQGAVILEENWLNAELYVVLRGKVSVLLENSHPDSKRIKPVELVVLTEGICFGEYSMFDKKPTSATVAAKTAVTLFKLSLFKLKQLLNEDQRLGMLIYENIIQALIHKARQNTKSLDVANSCAWKLHSI
jgi:CRP-like cAMP-binding protein